MFVIPQARPGRLAVINTSAQRPLRAMKSLLILSRLTAFVIFQACLIQSSCAADTNAVIPYKIVAHLCQVADAVDESKLDVRVFVSSNNKAVRPSDISLRIQSAIKGVIPLSLSTNGQFLNFPRQEELRRENPAIIANQPKGTLNLSVSIGLVIPDELTFRYSRLGEGVAEVNKAIKAQAGMMSWLAPTPKGVIFSFPKASTGKAKIEILSLGGRKTYTADTNAQIKLKLEKALLKENPIVQVSEKPGDIVPDME